MVKVEIHESVTAAAEKVGRVSCDVEFIRKTLYEMREAAALNAFGAVVKSRYVEDRMDAVERAQLARLCLNPDARAVCAAAARLAEQGFDVPIPRKPRDLVEALLEEASGGSSGKGPQ